MIYTEIGMHMHLKINILYLLIVVRTVRLSLQQCKEPSINQKIKENLRKKSENSKRLPTFLFFFKSRRSLGLITFIISFVETIDDNSNHEWPLRMSRFQRETIYLDYPCCKYL